MKPQVGTITLVENPDPTFETVKGRSLETGLNWWIIERRAHEIAG